MMILSGLLLVVATFSLSRSCEDIVREAPGGRLYGARIVLADSTGFVGNGYFLSAHGDRRNSASTWAIAYRPNYKPWDNVWNIEKFTRSGRTCFRIKKSGGRSSGRVLTAHSDRRGSDKRVLVHTANHKVDDECWNFERVATNTYKIYKILGRNRNMKLVADVGRDSSSFWVDVSSQGSHQTWRVYGNLELNSKVDLRNVRISLQKPGFHGHNYVLTAHSDRRNSASTWALAHRPGHKLSDELWNIVPFERQGKKCFRIQKSGGRNSGRVLTAHNDRRGSDSRVIVHTANHNLDDECWNFVRNPATNNYRIFKVLGRNQNKDLVADVGRNDHSFWTDLSSSRSMEWRVTNNQGQYLTESCNICPEGEYGRDRDHCTPCPEGTSVPEGEGITESDCTIKCDCGNIDDAFELFDTIYDVVNSGVTPMRPVDAGQVKVDASGVTKDQSTILSISEEVTESTFFEHTVGASITVGMEFKAKVPFVGESTVSTEITASYDYNWGEQRDETKTVTGSFPCVAGAGTIVECKALIFKFNAICPYTMIWQHKQLGSSCTCVSEGVFRKIAATRLEFYANQQKMVEVKVQ